MYYGPIKGHPHIVKDEGGCHESHEQREMGTEVTIVVRKSKNG